MLLLSVNPILMHSLSLLLLLLPLPAILMYRMLVYHQWPYILVRLPCYTMITGIYYTYIHIILVVTKVRSARRVPASDSRIGSERTFVPMAL